jgi:hypothetical protein
LPRGVCRITFGPVCHIASPIISSLVRCSPIWPILWSKITKSYVVVLFVNLLWSFLTLFLAIRFSLWTAESDLGNALSFWRYSRTAFNSFHAVLHFACK